MTNTELLYPKEEYFHSPHTGCPGCSLALAFRYFLKAMRDNIVGDEIVIVMPVGCSGSVSHLPTRRIHSQGRLVNELTVPFGSTATFAAGVKTALKLRGDTETEVVAWAGDGATFDIGFQALSAAAERNDGIIYICCDNEGYQNTGNQRSSATPGNVITSTNPYPAMKTGGKKDIALIMAAHNIPYVCTASVAYPDDFMKKIAKAKDKKGFRFLHVLCPCPTGWKFPADSTVKVARLAVQTGIFPLFEVENGDDFTINVQPKEVPIVEYLKVQGRYRFLTAEQSDVYQKEVDKRFARLQLLAKHTKKVKKVKERTKPRTKTPM